MNTKAPTGTPKTRRGSALLTVSMVLFALALLLGGLTTYMATATSMQQRSDQRLVALYAAEAALEQAYLDLRNLIFADITSAPDISATTAITNLTTAPTGQFSSQDGFTWRAHLTVPMLRGAPADGFPDFDPNQDLGQVAYVTSVMLDYQPRGARSPVTVHVQREVIYSITPIFRYAIFYNSDAELFPGAIFDVTGDVHINGRFYYGSTAALNFHGRVTTTNGAVNAFSPASGRTGAGGNVNFSQEPKVTTHSTPPMDFHHDSENPNMEGARELIKIPHHDHPDPHAEQRMFSQAGVKILVNTSAVEVTAPNGTTLAPGQRAMLTHDGTVIPDSHVLFSLVDGTLDTGSMHDFREEQWVTTTDVDVNTLTTLVEQGALPTQIPNSTQWGNSSHVPAPLRGQAIPESLRGKSLWNGILYVTDVGYQSNQRKGVRLLNGTHLPEGGLTVASENPAYIVGNYNTGGNPPSNTGSATANNFVSGYEVRGASVIADAVNIISANWIPNNYNDLNLNQRPAVNTTVNAAIISGDVPSANDNYSGGVENYPRLLENWSGRRFTYYGSLINLFASDQAQANWRYGSNIYEAPQRNWYFDINYLDPDRLPPGFVVVRNLKKGQWVQLR